MARVRQFAKDMGLSYNKAKNLVNKGRKLRDGGSSILENTMKKAKQKILPKKRPKTGQQKYMEEVIKQKGKSGQLDAEGRKNPYGGLDRKEGGGFPDLSGDGKVTKKDVLIGRGVIKKSRGGGLAIQGTQFRGVR